MRNSKLNFRCDLYTLTRTMPKNKRNFSCYSPKIENKRRCCGSTQLCNVLYFVVLNIKSETVKINVLLCLSGRCSTKPLDDDLYFFGNQWEVKKNPPEIWCEENHYQYWGCSPHRTLFRTLNDRTRTAKL